MRHEVRLAVGPACFRIGSDWRAPVAASSSVAPIAVEAGWPKRQAWHRSRQRPVGATAGTARAPRTGRPNVNSPSVSAASSGARPRSA